VREIARHTEQTVTFRRWRASAKRSSRNVDFDAKTLAERRRDSDSGFFASLIIGLMIYITLAVTDRWFWRRSSKKETRIAEILSRQRARLKLMMGKLVGLVGLTQLGLDNLGSRFFSRISVAQMSAAGMVIDSNIAADGRFVFSYIFFGVFSSTLRFFALYGSMVTTVQEGGQFSFRMLLLVGFFIFSFASSGTNSRVWVSIYAPFFAPITMPVRILANASILANRAFDFY